MTKVRPDNWRGHKYTLPRKIMARRMAEELSLTTKDSLAIVNIFLEESFRGLVEDRELVWPGIGRFWITSFDRHVDVRVLPDGKVLPAGVLKINRLTFRPHVHFMMIAIKQPDRD